MTAMLKALIIDNSPYTYTKLGRMNVWREAGFELIQSACDHSEAQRTLKTSGAELAVIFNKPPVITPARLIEELKGISPNTQYIIISPYDDSESMRQCFLLGALDYLCEPISEGRIREALIRAKERIDSTKESREYRLAADEFFEKVHCTEKHDKFKENLKDFILKCEGTTATTETAADHFGFNKDYFGRLFKARIGMTFGEFYKSFRISYAERLLASGRYRVYEVSELLGFSSVDYFTAVFKKITGRRPSDLKKYR